MRRVDQTVTATVGADGTATVRLPGPAVMQDVVNVDAISLRSTSASLPDATLYRGIPSSGSRLAYVADGRGGQFFRTGASDVINGGDVWSIQWTGATAGSSCSAAFSGTVTRRGVAAV